MSAEAVTPMPPESAPAKTRKKYHRRKRVARRQPTTPAAPQKAVAEKKTSSRIGDELDARILAAVKERTTVAAQLSQMQGLQAHYNLLNNEIESLLQLKERLSGQGRVTQFQQAPPMQPPNFAPAPAAIAPQFGRDVPPGVGSIPARQPAPNPHGNVAEMITGEGGFS